MAPTRVLPGDDPAAIAEAVAALRRGEPVAFPTETVYGLGADARDAEAVARVFALKERPRFDPIIVHLADASELPLYAVAEDAGDPRVARLAARFWPGPLTLVLRKRDAIPGIVTAGLDTVALRVLAHPVALALIAAAGAPLAAPSANPFGRVSPTRASTSPASSPAASASSSTAGHAGSASSRPSSSSPKVGRLSSARAGCPPRRSRPRSARSSGSETRRRKPRRSRPAGRRRTTRRGRRSRSWSPWPSGAHAAAATPVARPDPRLAARPGERLGVLAADDAGRAAALAAGGPFAAIEVLSPLGDPTEAAARLFDALHRLDAAGLDRIVAQPVREAGLGRAIMDRLRRAARAG